MAGKSRRARLRDASEWVQAPTLRNRETARSLAAKTPDGRNPPKLQGNTFPEIRQAWQQVAVDYETDPDVLRAARGAIADGNVLNAFVLWCLSRPAEELRQILIWGLRALEHLKDIEETVDLRRMAREDFAALGGDAGQDDEVGFGRDAGGRHARTAQARSPGAKRRSKRTG